MSAQFADSSDLPQPSVAQQLVIERLTSAGLLLNATQTTKRFNTIVYTFGDASDTRVIIRTNGRVAVLGRDSLSKRRIMAFLGRKSVRASIFTELIYFGNYRNAIGILILTAVILFLLAQSIGATPVCLLLLVLLLLWVFGSIIPAQLGKTPPHLFRRLARIFAYILAFTGGLAAFYSSISKPVVHSLLKAYGRSYESSSETRHLAVPLANLRVSAFEDIASDTWKQAVIRFLSAGGVLGLHMLYLLLLTWEGALSRPQQQLEWSHLAFPFILVLVYIVGAVESIYVIHGDTLSHSFSPFLAQLFGLKVFSTTLFFFFYVAWVSYDYAELRHLRELTVHKRTTETVLWLGIDLLSAVILFVAIVQPLLQAYLWPSNLAYMDQAAMRFESHPSLLSFSMLLDTVGIKDIVIGLAVGGYAFLSVVVRHALSEHFRGVYLTFLENARLTEGLSSPPPDKLRRRFPTEIREWAVGRAADRIRVVDFGCANGQRAAEILKLFNLNKTRVDILGIDKDPAWRDRFFQTMTAAGVQESRIRFRGGVAGDGPPAWNADLVIGSHVFFDEHLLTDFSDFLYMCRDGAWVVLRGGGQNSVVSAMIGQVAFEGVKPRDFHLWNRDTMSRIAKDTGLINAYSPTTQTWIESALDFERFYGARPENWRLEVQRGKQVTDLSSAGYPLCVIKQTIWLTSAMIRDFPRMIQLLFSVKVADQMEDAMAWQYRVAHDREPLTELACDDLVYLFRKSKTGRQLTKGRLRRIIRRLSSRFDRSSPRGDAEAVLEQGRPRG